jgi:hypothetical protein
MHQQAPLQILQTGVTYVYVLSGQADQGKVIEFYGSQLLPGLRQS